MGDLFEFYEVVINQVYLSKLSMKERLSSTGIGSLTSRNRGNAPNHTPNGFLNILLG